MCSVKVDETGTPSSVSTADGYGQSVDTFKDAQKSNIDGAGAKAKETIGEWGLPFELPTSCQALPTGAFNFTLDICQWQGMIHDLMAMVWLCVTAWACIGMVGRTMSGGS
ncbi:hypothetical protein DBA29_17130 [Xenophilus aerolatus]|nr:hypothetical protein [Xenophilus aerolatus]